MKNIIVSVITFISTSLTIYAQQDVHGLMYGSHKQNNLDLFLPAKFDAKTPFIVMLHGGAWAMGGKEYTDKTARDLRDRGFVVANVDYRYVNDSVHCTDLLTDIDNAISYLQTTAAQQYKFRTSGYNMAGISAGAHLALLYGYTTKKDIKAIAALCAPSVLDDAKGLDLIANNGLIHNIELLADAKYIPGQAVPKAFSNVSPYKQVTNIPTLLFHGDKDDLVPHKSSEVLYNILKTKNIDSKFLTMKGKGHDCGMNQADSEKQVLDEITNWVNKYN
ncbi:MAG: alpha/beta hydrolase [Bacteroidota bacterium]